MSSAKQDSSTPSSDSEASDSLLGRLVDEYFDLLQRGENPSLEGFVDRYPDQAETIRHALPALRLVGKGVEAAHANRDQELAPRELGDYRIIGEIGRGGMGVVYQAEQLSLGRTVALKVLPFAAILDNRQIQRFKTEANAAAMLHHDNIVPIYGVGCERGIYYYAMQYIEGQTLADVTSDLRDLVRSGDGPPEMSQEQTAKPTDPSNKDSIREGSQRASVLLFSKRKSSTTSRESSGRSWEPRDGAIYSANYYRNIAELGVQIAKALAYAHREGVIHRDIKPSNLMIDTDGKVWVTDFGLARIEAGSGVTVTGDVLGTLRYMSPEQLKGSSGVDHRCDVYSLGVTLFELLTLRPAIGDGNREETIRQIVEGNPPAPRKLNRYIPKELETIVLKACEKNPQDRYGSADELANDLQRFIDDLPIAAKRPTMMDAAIKWSRRHSDLSWAAAFFLLIGLLGTAVSTIWLTRLYRESSRLQQRENQARVDAEQANESLRRELYAKDMQNAFQYFNRGWSGVVLGILDRQVPKGKEIDYRGFEWHLLKKLNQQSTPIQLIGHQGNVNGLAVYDEGRRLASVGQDGIIRIWDLEANREIFQLVDPRFEGKKRPIYWTVDVSSDGKYLVAGSGVLSLWNLETREFIRDLAEFPTHITSAVFSPDDQLIAAHCADVLVKVVSLVDGTIREFETGHGSHRLTFSHDGRLLIAPFKERPVQGFRAWDTRTWDMVQECELKSPRGLVTSKDGQFLFYGIFGNSVRLSRFGEETILFESTAHRAHQSDIDWSPDNSRFAAVFADGVAICWKLRADWQSQPEAPIDGEPTRFMVGGGQANVVRFIGDTRIVVGSEDGVIRTWETENRDHVDQWTTDANGGFLTPDGKELWGEKVEGVVVNDAASGEMIHNIDFTLDKRLTHSRYTRSIAFNAAGDLVAIGRPDGQIAIWDRSRRQAIAKIDLTDQRVSEVTDLSFSKDGQWLASTCNDHTVRIYACESWKEVIRWDSRGLDANVEFSPDGEFLAIGFSDGEILLLETATWKRLCAAKSPLGCSDDCLRFSDDGRYLVTGHLDSVIRVWEGRTLDLLGELRGHQQLVLDLDVHPNNELLMSTSYDTSIRLWHLPTLTELGILHSAVSGMTNFNSVEFSPCGEQIYAIEGPAQPEVDLRRIVRWTIRE